MASHVSRGRGGLRSWRLMAVVVVAGVALAATLVVLLRPGFDHRGVTVDRHAGTSLATSPASAVPPASRSLAPNPADRRRGDSTTRDPRWSEVLRQLCARRAAAWRLGKPQLLSSVYRAGSPELALDRGMLRAYLNRGLRVVGVSMRFSVVAVQRELPDRASLLVVDRLAPAVARDASGHSRPLPHDLPTRHRIQLVTTPGGWRIASITPG